MLTAVHLILRFAGTTFQVFLSRRIGAAGLGLLQLTMSVGSLAMVAGMAGIRTATMYLTADKLGRRRPGQVIWVLSGCFGYSLLFSSAFAAALFLLAPWIAGNLLSNPDTVYALRLFAAFLPTTCLCGVMTGYFTAAGRIAMLSFVEVAEQVLSMAITLASLWLYAGNDPVRCCICVILGSGLGGCLTLLCLLTLRLREKPPRDKPISVAPDLIATALPLGAADVLKSGINTVENLMVPKRLALHPGTGSALAAFGITSGMVFPVMMFPACILYALAELLIPELARCAAAQSQSRIRYLTRRGLWIALTYGCVFSGLLFLLAEPLCQRLYKTTEAAAMLRLYALLVPMLYCDAIVDAMTKGLGQQRICVLFNIITSIMDVAGLYILLPKYGMMGYFFSFTITHAVNFGLSFWRLLKITAVRIPFYAPALTVAGLLLSMALSGFVPQPHLQALAYLGILIPTWYLFGVVNKSTLHWLKHLLFPHRTP